MDGFDRAEKWQAAATAVGALVAIVPAASMVGSIFIAIVAALGAGSLAGAAVMVWWLGTGEGNAHLQADARTSGRSTSRLAVCVSNFLPGVLLLGLAVGLHLRTG